MFRVLSALHGTGVPAPRPLWLDPEGESLGVPAFVMEFVEGSVPRQSYFREGPIADASPPERRRMVTSVIETIAKIHALDWQGRGLGFLKDRGRGSSWIERDLSWYWRFLESSLPEGVDAYRPVLEWLLRHQPAGGRAVVNHGDCQLGNYMFRGAEVAAVLDWEMTCLLPPEADLAYLCVFHRYLSTGMDGLPDGIPSEEGWLSEYERVSGHRIRNWDYYRTMMMFRLATIFSCGAARLLPPDQLEAARPVWGWFEHTLMEKSRDVSG